MSFKMYEDEKNSRKSLPRQQDMCTVQGVPRAGSHQYPLKELRSLGIEKLHYETKPHRSSWSPHEVSFQYQM